MILGAAEPTVLFWPSHQAMSCDWCIRLGDDSTTSLLQCEREKREDKKDAGEGNVECVQMIQYLCCYGLNAQGIESSVFAAL